MTGSSPASLLFRLPLEHLETAPDAVDVGKYEDLGVLEPKHIEGWLEKTPELLGEELLVITRQFSRFDKSQKRLDLLVLDRAGRLVVIEVKRDSSGSEQELQALHYAAYCSTFTVDDVVDEYRAHHGEDKGVSRAEAPGALDHFVTEGSLDGFNEDAATRIILVARSFAPEVTATVLWLNDTWGMDIACVELVPYMLEGDLLLSSSMRIPLPDASDFQIKRATKQHAAHEEKKVDWARAMEVMESIPKGHWISYQDLAVAAGGTARAGMAVGQYLARYSDLPPNCVHRVLRKDGTIAPNWKGDIGGHEEARALLEQEGLAFNDQGRADPKKRWKPVAAF